MSRLRVRLYEIVEKAEAGDRVSRIFDTVILTLILLSVASVVVETFEGLYERYRFWLEMLEIFSVTVFTVEYLLRIFTSDLHFPDRGKIRAFFRFLFSPMAVVDLLAIIPFYLPLLGIDLRFIRIFRLMRLLRVLKLYRYTRSLSLIRDAIREKRDELVVTLVLSFMLLFVAAVLMFELEHAVQPEKFDNILSTLWWAVATLTTVGYGDVYPVTPMGRILAAIIAILGIGMVALPTGLISSAFLEKIKKEEPESGSGQSDPLRFCPHCGKVVRLEKDG